MYRRWWPQLEQWITDLLRAAQDAGELAAELDPSTEARILLAVPDGLSVGLLLGHHTPEAAVDLVDHALDRLFTTR